MIKTDILRQVLLDNRHLVEKKKIGSAESTLPYKY